MKTRKQIREELRAEIKILKEEWKPEPTEKRLEFYKQFWKAKPDTIYERGINNTIKELEEQLILEKKQLRKEKLDAIHNNSGEV